MHTNSKGFSLLELSVSLTIIALIAAAVTSGMALKDNLELQQIMEDVSLINTAIENFETTHSSLPGDMWNAENIFGATLTNNGNGNGQIETSENEVALVFQHLSLGGFIQGSYAQTLNPGGVAGVTEAVGILQGPAKATGYTVRTYEAPMSSFYISVRLDRFSELNGSAIAGNAVLSAFEAWSLDSKYDDALPLSGSLQALDGDDVTNGECVLTPQSTYNLQSTAKRACRIIFGIRQ